MLEYNLAIILIVVTFLSAFLSTKIPLLGMMIFIIDIIMLAGVALDPTFIMGYQLIEGEVTTVTQSFTEFQIITIIAIMLNLAGTIYGAFTVLRRG